MSASLSNKWQDKSKNGALFFSVVGVEVVFLVVMFILDVYFHFPLYTFGRFMHFTILCYFTLLLWSGLQDGELTCKCQVILFVIIPFLEFFVINIIGISNLWGLLFLAIYGGALASIYNIDFNNGSNSGITSGKIFSKMVGKVFKDLTR